MTVSDRDWSDICKSDLIGEESGADHFSEPQDPTSKNTKASLDIVYYLHWEKDDRGVCRGALELTSI